MTESPRGSSGAMPEGVGGQLHGRGEARVEVERPRRRRPRCPGVSARLRMPPRTAPARPRRWPVSDRGRARAVGNRTSVASAPDHTKTARSATPARRAAASEQTTSAAPWSDPRKAVIRLVYGSQTMRLSGEGVAISSALRPAGNHAYGWPAATSVNGANSRPWPAGGGPRRVRHARPPRSRTAGRRGPAPATRRPSRPAPTPGRSSPTTGSGGSPPSRQRGAGPAARRSRRRTGWPRPRR